MKKVTIELDLQELYMVRQAIDYAEYDLHQSGHSDHPKNAPLHTARKKFHTLYDALTTAEKDEARQKAPEQVDAFEKKLRAILTKKLNLPEEGQ